MRRVKDSLQMAWKYVGNNYVESILLESARITLVELQKEQDSLNSKLHRPMEHLTLEQKWGTCHETIGKGTSGVVRIVHKMEGNTERLYAVKELRKRSQESSQQYIQRIASEFHIAANLDHINIIRTLDILPITTSSMFCQVMEYSGGGDLFDLISSRNEGLELLEANCFFKQLLRGVEYMHSMGVTHRDLKPENVLLTRTGCLKISDFGSATFFSRDRPLVRGLAGSEPYMAPEEFTDPEYEPRRIDVWSCGIIYMSMRKSTYLWQIAKAGEDDDYDKYLNFRRILDEERENAHRQVMGTNRCVDEHLMTDEERVQERIKRETSILKARETIRRRAKERRFDTLEGIDIEAKRVVYPILSSSKILSGSIFCNNSRSVPVNLVSLLLVTSLNMSHDDDHYTYIFIK
ncbi:MAG: kinase-like domain-containing protein [Benjaminiella poitrasii]|nr:MAG: kinase-like domain-containing protein [Benjaminiella poitrasii]